MQENKDILGEEPIGFTPDGEPVYPSEETDNTLRRRIQTEQAETKRQERERIKGLGDAKLQQRSIDGLMQLRMGINWGRRR